MPRRIIEVDGDRWQVAVSGRSTQYNKDEFGLVFTRGTGPDREQPAEELDRQHPPPAHRAQIVHGPLDLGNARPARLRREGMGQEITDHAQQGAETKADQAELPPGTIGQQHKALLGQPVHTGFKQSADHAGQEPVGALVIDGAS